MRSVVKVRHVYEDPEVDQVRFIVNVGFVFFVLFYSFFFSRFLVRSTFRVFLRMLNTLILILKNKLLELLRQLRVADVMVAKGTNRDF